MKDVNETALIEAKKWDMINTAMEPVEVPYNCKVVYRYQQPVIHDNLKNLPKDSMFISFEGWGIVTVQLDYVMTPQEKGQRQEDLRKEGAIIIGNMRLTSQTLFRDKNIVTTNDLENLFEE